MAKKKPDDMEALAQALAERLRPHADASFLEEFTTHDFSDYIDKPIEFIRDILGIELWDKQKEICLSVLKNRNTVAESGHSVGKTLTSAGIGCWWLSTRPGVLVTSAPTAAGVNNLLWRQMRSMKNSAKKPLPGHIFDTPRWEGLSSKACYGIGLSPRKDNAEDITGFQGHHHVNLLVILDEGAGLNKLVFEASLSLATGESNKVLVIGNPISKSGAFYNLTQSKSWRHLRISCLEHPNIKERREVIPGAVSWQWVRERIDDWCRPGSSENSFFFDGSWWIPSPVFMARVLGQPTDEADDQLIAYSWIESAVARWQDTESSGTYGGDSVVGLDVARQGADSSVIVHRIGDHIKKVIQRHGNDIAETVGWLINYIKENNIDYAYVDDVGIGGAVTDLCRSQGYSVTGVHVQKNPKDRNKFHDLHDEIWWTVREKLRTGDMSIPDDPLLIADLAAMRTTGYDMQGRPTFEKKEEMKKRLGRSPDSGDALALSYTGHYLDIPTEAKDYSEVFKEESRWPRGEVGQSRWVIGRRKTESRWRP